jgi:hypothetical protein
MFDDAFYSIGGVPRHLLNEAPLDFLDKVSGTMDTMQFEEFSKPQHRGNPHYVSKLEPRSDHSSFIGYTFVSKGVENMWYDKGKQVNVAELKSQYEKCVEEKMPRGAQGEFYERYVRACLAFISKNTPLHLFALDKKKKSPQKTTVRVSEVIGKKNQVVFNGDDASAVISTTTPTLYVPKIDNFPFVDFLIVNGKSVTLIQVTVKPKHKPTLTTVPKVLDLLKTNGLKVTKLVWVSPPNEGIKNWQPIEKGGTIADYDKISQYLCVLPERQ